LGIGTNVAAYKLQVETTDATAYSPSNTLTALPIGWLNNNSTTAGSAATLRLDGGASGGNAVATISSINVGSGSSSLTFGTRNAGGSTTERARITQLGNLHLGTFVSDSGQRLQVTGDTLLKGSGNTSATTALSVQNSDASSLFRVLNQGFVRLGNAGATSPTLFTITTGFSSNNLAGTNLSYYNYTTTESAVNGSFAISGEAFSSISAKQINIYSLRTFAPTSGTALHDNINISSTINQTGGANGITRGLYIQPTLTAAADWRSIEWSNNSGWGLYGAGTSPNYLNGNLSIGSTFSTNAAITIQKVFSGAIAFGIYNLGQMQATAANISYFQSQASTSATAITITNLSHYFASTSSIGAGSAITNQFGYFAQNTLIGATNNYGFFGDIASGTNRWNFYANGTAANYFNGNTIMGTLAADSGEKLQVNGTAKITGASSFGGNMALTQNFNGVSSFQITNNTSGINSVAAMIMLSSNGVAEVGKFSATKTANKIILGNDSYFYNNVAGDISILNDFASGSIKMAAGGSSTAHMTIKSNGRINMSSLPTSATGLSAGDLWNDGGTLKIA